ncbi:MAG: wax ester/triacylglycerol synthase domain-containing protein, partial [Actinomycetota bacterium]
MHGEEYSRLAVAHGHGELQREKTRVLVWPVPDVRLALLHVRQMALPAPGTMRQLQDLVTLLIADPFDRSRP